MHRNSLIVMLTVSATEPITVDAPPSDAAQFVAACRGMQSAQGTALKSLTAFMGATAGSIFCTDRFISSVMGAYENGLEAKQLVQSITDELYEQACKPLPVLDAETQGVAAGISRQLFGRCLPEGHGLRDMCCV